MQSIHQMDRIYLQSQLISIRLFLTVLLCSPPIHSLSATARFVFCTDHTYLQFTLLIEKVLSEILPRNIGTREHWLN